MRLLDLFCGAGGAATGYHQAGFEVVGVDSKPQKRYPFEFHQADALDFLAEYGHLFDVIHASPPCQRFSSLKSSWNARLHKDLLTPTLAALAMLSIPWVVENVPGAPMPVTVILCGSMFGLGSNGAQLRRHRLFAASVSLGLTPPHQHGGPVIGVYGGHGRDRRRKTSPQNYSIDARREAMGIDWMTGAELSQAVPPAYTEWVGRQLRAALAAREKEKP
jgi:DNA (cytosine-5)-methyltransferase 1